MPHPLAVLSLLLALAVSVFAADSAEQTIARLEQQWAEAQKTGRADAVAPLLADSFVNTDASADTYGKDRLLANLKGGVWEKNFIRDVHVIAYGNTAIATGIWEGKGVDGDGTRMDRRERWTDTWIKLPTGQWQCVASQQTEWK